MFRVRAALLAVIVATPLTGQGRNKRPKNQPPAVAPAAAVPAAGDSLNNMKFRNLRPPDGGKTWQAMGLGDVGQISRIVIDPANPDIVFVAALGHVWAPNPERGVFRTADGGKTWQKVLFVNDTTGAADLVMVPGNPRVLLAGMWQFVRRPWELVSGGATSGIYRSTDGGLTWQRLKQGLPAGLLGRIALAVGPTNPTHVYALVETTQGMLWDSKDQGDHWTKVSDFHG